MKKRFIPLDKQSKQKQREFYAARRSDWGGINPVTRKPPNPKAYNRKKTGQRFKDESGPGFFVEIKRDRCYTEQERGGPVDRR
jgi:hypothetical protein